MFYLAVAHTIRKEPEKASEAVNTALALDKTQRLDWLASLFELPHPKEMLPLSKILSAT